MAKVTITIRDIPKKNSVKYHVDFTPRLTKKQIADYSQMTNAQGLGANVIQWLLGEAQRTGGVATISKKGSMKPEVITGHDNHESPVGC